jgi:protocatechuate 3,4-dioxygenase beta subunit
MKIFLFITYGLVAFIQDISAQADTVTLFQEAKKRLEKDHARVSAILTDKKYLPIHPQTSFRELIKDHCETGLVSITTAEEPGRYIKVLCQVKDEAGKPVAGALVYLYQTDSKGWYAADAPHVLLNEGDFRHARLFGYVKTDANGVFELHTVKPSGYPKSDLPAHIHVHVSSPQHRPYGTEFLFDDDDRLKGTIREQSIRNQFLIAKPVKATAPFEQLFNYEIKLEKQR